MSGRAWGQLSWGVGAWAAVEETFGATTGTDFEPLTIELELPEWESETIRRLDVTQAALLVLAEPFAERVDATQAAALVLGELGVNVEATQAAQLVLATHEINIDATQAAFLVLATEPRQGRRGYLIVNRW